MAGPSEKLIDALMESARSDEQVAGAMRGLSDQVGELKGRVAALEGTVGDLSANISRCPQRGEKWLVIWSGLSWWERRLILVVSLLVGLSLVARLLALPISDMVAPATLIRSVMQSESSSAEPPSSAPSLGE